MSWALYAILAVSLAAALLSLRRRVAAGARRHAGRRDRRRSGWRSRSRSPSGTAACSTRAARVAAGRLARRRVPAGDRAAVRDGRGVLDRLSRASTQHEPGFAGFAKRYYALLNLFGCIDAAGPAGRRFRDAVGGGRADDDHLRAAGRDRPHRRGAGGGLEVRADRLQRARDRAAVDHRPVRDRHPRARQRLHPPVRRG